MIYSCIRNKVSIIGLTIYCMATFSCEKFVDVSPTDRLVTNTVFTDSLNSVAAILGVYTDIIQDPYSPRILAGGVSVTTALSADELKAISLNDDDKQFYQNAISHQSNTWNASYLWRSAYQIVYKTNACLEGLQNSTTLTTSLRNRLKGEMLFIRAFSYYYLVNLYGDVPYIKTTDFSVNASLPRTGSKAILEDLVLDLLEAKSILSYQYPSPGRQRLNKAAVETLLARIYLIQKNWSAAEENSTNVISQTMYSLESDLSRIFMPNNSEAIWQLNPIVPGVETFDGTYYIPTSSTTIPKVTISTSLFSSFSSGDKRKEKWIGKNVIESNGNKIEYYYPSKYKLGRDNWSSQPLESYSVIRLSELYLIRAEARANLNKLDGPNGAVNDINTIRRRASLTDTSANNSAEALNIVFHEKRLELFTEWGVRWIDLKRTEGINSVMQLASVEKENSWNSNWQLFPIPFSEIQANPSLVQNAGYPQ